jgi:hypothetical protein
MDKIAKHCNCRTEDDCPCPGDDHECCSQKVRGKDPRFGLWILKGNCDERTGLPVDAHKHGGASMISEGFLSGTKEGYDGCDEDDDEDESGDQSSDCTEWRRAFHVLLFIMLLGIVTIYLKWSSLR